jgi:MscS family membrane protein
MQEKFDPFCFLHQCSKAFEGHYGPFIQIFGIIALVLICNFFVKTILLKLYNYFLRKHLLWSLSFVSALHKPLTYFVWFVAGLTSFDLITFGLFSFHLSNMHLVLSIGAVLAFGWFLLRWNAKFLHYGLELSQNDQFSFSASKIDLLSKVATIVIIFVTVFLLMDVTGRNMHTLIAFGGIGGLALAFASQQVVANFFGGMMVYLTKPFTLGEWINLPERKIEGHIEEIGWYLTRIRNFEKRPIYVPNSVFTQSIVITPSRMSHERFHHTIGLRYNDIGVIKAIVDSIKLMLLKHPHIDQNSKIEVYFVNFGASSLDINVSAYMSISSGVPFSSVRQDILLKIAEIITQNGAEMATPTHIIELQGGSIAAKLSDSQSSSLTSND